MDLTMERAYPTPVANSPLLPMLLLSLMRQKIAPDVSGRRRDEYDYIIVGAGTAGSIVASRLTEIPCVSVLLLEAGKSPPVLSEVPLFLGSFWYSDLSWNYKTVAQKHTGGGMVNRQLEWPSGKALGGSSILNGLRYVRGNRKNYDDWEAMGATGWNYDNVLPYFKKLEDNKNINDLDEGYHATGGPVTVERPDYSSEMKTHVLEAVQRLGYKVVDSNGKIQTGFDDVQENMRDGQRCSMAKAYLVPAENRTNLDIMTSAFVKKIMFEGNRATGVIFEYQNATQQVKAKREVIMAAGTINTAQLLMLSGVGPRNHLEEMKIPVIADLPVGENLQNHCAGFVNFELDSSITSITEKMTNETNIRRYIDNRSGILATAGGSLLLAFLKGNSTSPSEDFPNYQLDFLEGSTETFKTGYGIKPEVYDEMFKPYENKTFMVCAAQAVQPRSRGTVRLNSADPFDPPLIDPNYFEDSRDIEDTIQGLKTCNLIGATESLQNIGSVPFRTLYPGCEMYEGDEDRYMRCQLESLGISMSHDVGTAKMGNPRDKSTVVDPQLRVKGVRGLRVVDASVMPLIPSGNIHIPVIMVAEKAADIIKEDINC